MNYTLRPFTNEMWAALEEEQSCSSKGSTCPSRSPQESEAEAEDDTKNDLEVQMSLTTQPQAVSSRPSRLTALERPAVPLTPRLHPEIDPQHLNALQTLATVATSSPSSLSRLTEHVSRRNMDETVREGEEEEELEEEEHGSSASPTSPHDTWSPRGIHSAQQNDQSQSETQSQRKVTPLATRQKRQRELGVESPPARNLRRRPSPPVASSSSHRPLYRNSLPSSYSQTQTQTQTINGLSTSQIPPNHQDDIVVSHSGGSRRPVLDISSKRLVSLLRAQLRDNRFQRYTMSHPKPDGTESGKKWRCAYEFEPGNRCNVAWSRKAEARRHAFTHETHLRWVCPSLAADGSSCGKLFARQDAAIRHVEKSKTCTNLAANRSEGFPILVWEEEDETVANIVTIEWTEDDNDEGNGYIKERTKNDHKGNKAVCGR